MYARHRTVPALVHDVACVHNALIITLSVNLIVTLLFL